MHRALLNPDVLRAIAQNVSSSEFRARHDTVQLALTCRAFFGPAADQIWRVTDGLKPLIQLLPKEYTRIDKKGVISISRAPPSADWERFKIYASRVLKLMFTSRHPVRPDTYHVLHQYYPGPGEMLPNLQEIISRDGNASAPPYVFLFIQPTLRSLNFGPSCPEDQITGLSSLEGGRAPHLEQLTIEGWDMAPELSKAIASLNHLTDLNLGRLSVHNEALVHLSSLPNLGSLTIQIIKDNADVWKSDSWGGFPRLTSLELMTVIDDGATIASLLRATNKEMLLSLVVDFHPRRTERFRTRPPANLRSLLASVGEFKSLVEFSLKLRDLQRYEGPRILDGDALLPVFLPQLMSLTIDSLPVEISDTHIHALAAQCPNLHSLELRPNNERPQISIASLVPLVKHCPLLDRVTLQLAPVEAGWMMDPAAIAGLKPCPLTMLNLLCSRFAVGAAKNVARFLSTLFPLALVSHSHSYPLDNDDDDDDDESSRAMEYMCKLTYGAMSQALVSGVLKSLQAARTLAIQQLEAAAKKRGKRYYDIVKRITIDFAVHADMEWAHME